ncbi:hypothetical protein MJO29_004186 [Puccinia striiformis f. sp. tritici]|uniref:Uncharacterized protein n=2 Tax=Puccinia striiformis TaxID=27350 RepID=A0A2S4WG44_9BASI|nr:hypothetical protein Pst134EB_033354 [Puccinia striiformis f. sp. tritici]KAI7963759.1 hypothetical protein MJO29_004186 [Puccinia striiformis f. sp. tritici]KAI9617054.1 hypothetical protein H4Q26_010692 [Puccinia striiformis f. sp. tritici PST-130]POW11977.1 hypothetical protein PSTT_04825 [Puccinia striiformis]POW20711.1 hypothetical protein PSHT_03183 [Puccinia striiformis]
MISKVFLAYILIALSAAPPTAAAETDGPATASVIHPLDAPTAPTGPSTAHPATPVNLPTGENLSPTSDHQAANAPAISGHSPADTTAPVAVSKAGNFIDTATGHSVQKDAEMNATSPHAPEHYQEILPSTTCFPRKKSHGIENHHCDKALNKIVFAANQTLDKFSSLIFGNYKTCNVYVHKPQNATLTKVQLSLMVHSLTSACHSVGGVSSQASQIAVKVERGTKENTHEVDRPICKKQTCPLTQSDCLSAFYQLPTNANGIFVHSKGRRHYARVTSGNCTVTASTTDLSAFVIPRQFILPTMKKLINECAEHPGKIYLSGGAKGYNGDILLSAHPANEQLCE